MAKSKIGTIEAIALILSMLAPFTVISLSRTFINETKSSALLNIIYVTSICLFIGFLIYTLFKKFPVWIFLTYQNIWVVIYLKI